MTHAPRAAATAVAAAVALLAGCSTLGSRPAATEPLTVPPSPTPSSLSSASSVPHSAAGTAAAGAVCTAARLRVTAGRVDAGAGQRYVPLVFTNTGTSACTLRGFPGVAGLGTGNRQVTQARRAPVAVRTVTLPPNGSASAVVHATAVPGPGPTCPPAYPALLVTPPGTTTSVRVAVSLPACGGLTVRPVVAGTTGL